MGARLSKGLGSKCHAEGPIDTLTDLGCDREVLEALLAVGHDKVFQQSFSRVCDRLAPPPKRLRAIAAHAEELAAELEVLESSPVFCIVAPKHGHTLRDIADSIKSGCVPATLRLRHFMSYREMGKTLRPALLAYYARKQTGRPRWKELADLLGEDDPDKLRKTCKGAIRRITLNDTLPDMMEAFLSVARLVAGKK